MIWRRLLVPGSVRLAKLHEMFQAAMGWTDSHLHAFTISDQRYGMHFDDWPDDEIDEKEATVLQVLRDQRRFTYEYDFGDNWQHEVIVEELSRISLGLKFAVCIDGQNACPPEDCGGTSGYERMLEAISDPDDEEHDSYVEWLGGPFDATVFNLTVANAALQRLR